MASPKGFSEVWQAVLAEFGTIPRRGLIYLAIATVAGMASDLYLWSHRPTLLPTDYALGAVLVIGWIAISYAVLMAMVEKPVSLSGFAKFLAASAVVALPFLLLLAGLILGARTELGPWVVVLGLLAMLALILILPILSGWPVLQSLSNRVIDPLTALRATHGIRLPLIVMSFVVGGLGRVVPATSSTEDLAMAVLFASGSAIVSTVSAMIGFGVAVVAYRYMRDTLPADII